ncbi:hypothetical protein ACQ86B_24630 [Mycolicibacterium aichiense]|uniref:hypothetical protein n=1 Tax=Mycolicibacterium aichiense TaxID=1799 RepID=UPI003D67659D
MPTIIAIVVALIAIAVAIGAWFRPAPKPEAPAAKTYSNQEVNDAKKAVCDAFNKVHSTLVTNAGKSGDDPTQAAILAVNGRLATYAAGDFLIVQLQGQPAAPAELAGPVRDLGITYQSITLDQIGDASRTQLDNDYQKADTLTKSITEVCA